MLMVDSSKAIMVGDRDVVVEEIAFIMDKLCIDKVKLSRDTYEDVQKLILNQVQVLRKERKNGIERSHPSNPRDSENPRNSKDLTSAEVALEEAMKEIKRMKKEAKKKKSKRKDRK